MALAITGAICDIIDASLLKLNAYYRCNKSSENVCFALDTDDINLLQDDDERNNFYKIGENYGQHIQTVYQIMSKS